MWGTPPNLPYKTYQLDTPIATWKNHVFYVWKDPKLRGRVTMIKDGKSTTNFIDSSIAFSNQDMYAIGIDADGYIHIIHSTPNTPNTLPELYQNATNLYWCSMKPGDITNFEFRGNHPTKKIPTWENTHISLHSDRKGVLFYMTRVQHQLRLYRYDVGTQMWTELSIEMLHDDADGLAHLNFDLDNNLHLVTFWNHHLIHVLSRDGGDTWSTMSSTEQTELPLQGKSITDGLDGLEAVSVVVDKHGSPCIFLEPLGYIRWLRKENKWSSPKPLDEWQRPLGFLDESGILNIARSGAIWRSMENDLVNGRDYKTALSLRNIAGQRARETGDLIGHHRRKDNGYDLFTISPKIYELPEPGSFYFLNIRTGEEKDAVGNLPSANWTIGYHPSQETDAVEFFVGGSSYRTEKTPPYIMSGDRDGEVLPLDELFQSGTIISVVTSYGKDQFSVGTIPDEIRTHPNHQNHPTPEVRGDGKMYFDDGMLIIEF